MFDLTASKLHSPLKHLDSGLDSSISRFSYSLVLSVIYIGVAFSISVRTSAIFLFGGILLLFLLRTVLFSLFSVQFAVSKIENRNINPVKRINNWRDIFVVHTLLTLVIFVGCVVFIVPGIYFGYRFSHAVPLVTLQKKSPKQSFIESYRITQDEITENVTIAGLVILVSVFLSVGILSSYLVTFEFMLVGWILIGVFVYLGAVFELGVIGGIASLEIMKR